MALRKEGSGRDMKTTERKEGGWRKENGRSEERRILLDLWTIFRRTINHEWRERMIPGRRRRRCLQVSRSIQIFRCLR